MLHLGISWGLLVLIWLVQVIVYPAFHRIPAAGFVEFHRWYVSRITAVVLPLMVVEAMLTIWWLWDSAAAAAFIAALLVGGIWLSTFMLQVPIHNRLKSGKQDMLIRRLVASNWIRTIAWSLKAMLVTAVAIGRSPG